MAKISDLKKDVDFVTSEIITQCFVTAQLFPETDNEKLNEIIYKAVGFKTTLIQKINAYPKKKTKPEVKAYFKQLEKDIVEETRTLLKQLEAIKKK